MAVRRLLLLMVVTAIALAGAAVRAGAPSPVHHGATAHTIGQHEHEHAGARHDHGAEAECMQVGHCFPVQLIFSSRIDAAEVVPGNVWGVPDDVRASSLKPEASTPPPRAA